MNGRICGVSWALVASLLFMTPAAWARTGPGIYDGSANRAVDLRQALRDVHAGGIVIVTEQHDLPRHHENELVVLQTLKGMNLRISVGLEFLYYPDQPLVDRYVGGELQEPDFLGAVRWTGYPFEWYRPLILFSRESGGRTRALNAPERLTRALAQKGLAGLSDEERSLLPPDFHLGSDAYFERFAAAVREHSGLPADAIRNFFAAQSAWDDTMAWQAREYVTTHPDQVLVIIVGDFHAAYGGGLPDRLRARGATDVLVISQVNASDLSDEEVRELLAPHPRYGMRADFVWLTVLDNPMEMGGIIRTNPR